jgi:hypothetical protein
MSIRKEILRIGHYKLIIQESRLGTDQIQRQISKGALEHGVHM